MTKEKTQWTLDEECFNIADRITTRTMKTIRETLDLNSSQIMKVLPEIHHKVKYESKDIIKEFVLKKIQEAEI